MKLPVVHDRFSFQDLTEKYHMKTLAATLVQDVIVPE